MNEACYNVKLVNEVISKSHFTASTGSIPSESGNARSMEARGSGAVYADIKAFVLNKTN